METMKVECLPIGLYEENTYLLHDHGHVLVIDPGRHASLLMRHIDRKEIVDGIVLTHGHEDHVGAADELADHYGVGLYLNQAEWPAVTTERKPQGFAITLYHPLTDLPTGSIQIGSFPLQIYRTPGHSAGSVLIRYRNVLFTGDTLFAGTVGRTDLFSGNERDMECSLQTIRTLPNDLLVYPGHGPASTIKQEKQLNPYLRKANSKIRF